MSRGKLFAITLTYIAVAALGALGLKLYFDRVDTPAYESRTATPSDTSVLFEDPDQVVKRVGRHILLPAGETPRVVSVSSVELLKKDQPFFQYAKNGDKLLVYSDKVILYNPDDDIVIDIAYIRPGEEGTATGSALPNY